MDINKTQINPLTGISALLITFVIGSFLYSGSPAVEFAVIAAGLAVSSLGVLRICANCGLRVIVCFAAGILFAFSPYMTQLAILNPYAPLIAAAGIWALIPWVGSMTKEHGVLGLSFVLIALPGAVFAALFTLLANPQAMDAIGVNTCFPLPVSEPPYPVLAGLSEMEYAGKIPVAASYLMLLFAIPGLFRLNLETALVCIIAAVLTVPAFDKPFFDIPPAIWAIYPILAISILSANGVGILADFFETRRRIRPIWIFIVPILEVLALAYIMTY